MDTTTNPYAELAQKYTDSITQQNELLEQQSAIQEEQSKANTEQAISEIEQQKEYTQQDFTKEAKGAYSDYMKTVNPYGVQAENTYANGLGNSGYSETSKLNAYNTYQNRYATAKESTDRLMEDFNNQINEARLSGNAEIAEIALNKLQTQMDNLWNQLSMETSLTDSQVSYNQWLEEFEYQKQQDEIANQLAREELELEKASASSSSSSSSSDDYSWLTELLNSLYEDESGNSGDTSGTSSSSSSSSSSTNSSSSSLPSLSSVANALYLNNVTGSGSRW